MMTRRTRLRHLARALAAVLLLTGCRAVGVAPAELGEAERAAIADTIRRRLAAATDLTGSGEVVVARLLSLYPDTGRIVSAATGQITTTREALAGSIRQFWESTGQYMQRPVWEWGPMHVDVLAPDAAIVTAAYRIPHHTPRGEPHVLGGVWTAALVRRGERWVIVQEHLSDTPPELLAPDSAAHTGHGAPAP